MIGSSEIGLLLLLMALGWGLMVWGLADAAGRPQSAWTAAEENKTLWVALQAIALVVPFGFVIPIVYLVSIRPRVRDAQDTAGPPAGPPRAGPPPEPPARQGFWTD